MATEEEWHEAIDVRSHQRGGRNKPPPHLERINRIYRPVDQEPDRALDSLLALRQLREQLAKKEQTLVGYARRLGLSWQQIGEQLGITKQAAQQRYVNDA